MVQFVGSKTPESLHCIVYLYVIYVLSHLIACVINLTILPLCGGENGSFPWSSNSNNSTLMVLALRERLILISLRED